MSSWESCTFDPMSMRPYPNTQIVQVVFECGNFLCRPCVHAYTQIQCQYLCPVCEWTHPVGGNTLTPIYGSEHANSGDVGNNAPFADQGLGAYCGEIFSLDSYCIFVSTFLIIQPILFAIYLIM